MHASECQFFPFSAACKAYATEPTTAKRGQYEHVCIETRSIRGMRRLPVAGPGKKFIFEFEGWAAQNVSMAATRRTGASRSWKSSSPIRAAISAP